MALIKYTGTENVVVTLNGERKLIRPNKIFSGPINLKNHDGFILIGESVEDVVKKSRSDKSLKFEIKQFHEPLFDVGLLDESGLPKVSICIVTKDGDGVIQRCVDSIFEHVKYPSFEIILCDTGTTDKKVLDYYDAIKDKVTIYSGHEYNFSKNNNFMAKQSTGDALLFMNNDVFLTYDAISKMVGHILCSNIGCVGHRMVWDRDKTKIQHDGQVIYKPDGQWHGPGHHNYNRDINEAPRENVRVEGVTAAFLMTRKSLFEKVGGFDEAYKDIYQDVDLNLKISKLGYDNFCIRDNFIVHVDHSSRKVDGTQESIYDAKKFSQDWVRKGLYPIKKKVKYSVLVCATNKKQLQDLHDSIKSREEYEIIFINNTSNYFWSSEALNMLTSVSEGEYIFWMHQDVTFDANEPFSTVEKIAKDVGNFGILGPAGIQVGGKGGIRGVDFSSLKYNFNYLRCQTLDEFCLIGKRSNGMKFDEYLDHFHFYGADICLEASKKNLTNYVIKLPITHHSGGDINLKKKGGYESYLKQGKKLFKKWNDEFPFISTTTMHYRDKKVFWYLGMILELEPCREEIDLDNIDETPNVKTYQSIDSNRYLKKKEDGVSIAILNKDKPELIKTCIELLLTHIKQENVEILIGDTGSTNKETLDFYDNLPGNVSKVDVGEYHFSRNNNDLARLAKFNKTIFMNNDVFINSDITEKMTKLLRDGIGVVGLKLLYEDGNIQHAGVEMVISETRNPKEWYLPEHIDYKVKNFDKRDELVDCVTGACLMMPTELFIEYGGFDNKFAEVFQDVDLCLKMNKIGYKTMCCNEAHATHLESASRDPAINTPDYNLMTERWGSIKY